MVEVSRPKCSPPPVPPIAPIPPVPPVPPVPPIPPRSAKDPVVGIVNGGKTITMISGTVPVEA
ncbi:MAG TPA: hypothetical protein DHV56_06315 [Rhodobacter sp.]|nr:hypothetical protein [Rhodobacter sp.]